MTTESAILEHRQHLETVRPGVPQTLGTAATIGTTIPQGDLYFCVIGAIPPGYGRVENPTAADRQLVPDLDHTQGEKHVIDSFDGVELWRLPDWGKNPGDRRGPVLIVRRTCVVSHAEHAAVTLEARPEPIGCYYQRNWNAEQAAERRARD